MIYILTGVAKSGKSLIASEIKKRYPISVFSTDYIMMMLHHGNADLDLDIYASDSTVAHKIEPYVLGLVKTMIQNKDDVLLEGVHFNTPFARMLLDKYPDDIRILYLGYKNISTEDKVEELYRHKDVIDNPWIFNHRGEKVEDIVTYLIEESQRIYSECTKWDLLYLDIHDITTQSEDIIQTLLNVV